jgi:hypothetical protein
MLREEDLAPPRREPQPEVRVRYWPESKKAG